MQDGEHLSRFVATKRQRLVARSSKLLPMEPPRHAQVAGVLCPRIFRYAGMLVLTVDVSWTGITMRPVTSCIATTSRNRTGQEVSHSDPHVGGLSKSLACSHGVLHSFTGGGDDQR